MTIKDVAKKAGVSIATVSAVINNTKYVSDDLRDRVNQAIEDLGYRPNRIARSLKRRESKLIGVLVTEITNPFYPLLLEGVEEAAQEAGYNLLLSTTGDVVEKELKIIETMIEQGADGLVLATVDDNQSPIMKLIEQEKIPTVLINRAPQDYQGSMVCVDSYKVGRLATQHLIDSGHHQIAFMGGERQNSIQREAGFRDTMQANGIPIREEWLLNGNYNAKKTHDLIKELIASGDIPTAVFAGNDLMAFAVAKAFLTEGYRIPEDISVVGSDNIPFTADFRVPLTTVDVQKYEMGRVGCELLLSMFDKKEGFEHRQVLLDPELVIRDSTTIYRQAIEK